MYAFLFAAGSALILMFLFLLLPSNFSQKGKFILVITSFLLGMGGLAVATAFSLWQSALLLLLFVFFITFVLNNRLGSSLYKEKQVYYRENSDELSNQEIEESEIESITNSNSVQSLKIIKAEDDLIFNQPIEQLSNVYIPDEVEDDISFFLNRTDEEGGANIVDQELHYFSELENIVENQTEDQSWLEELTEKVEPPSLSLEKVSLSQKESENPVLEILNALDEAAASKTQDDLIRKK